MFYLLKIFFSNYKTIQKCMTVYMDFKLVDYIEERNDHSDVSFHSSHFGLKGLNPFPYLNNELRFAPSTMIFQNKELSNVVSNNFRDSFNHLADMVMRNNDLRNVYFYNKNVINSTETDSIELQKMLNDFDICNTMIALADSQCLLLQSFRRFASKLRSDFYSRFLKIDHPCGDDKQFLYFGNVFIGIKILS